MYSSERSLGERCSSKNTRMSDAADDDDTTNCPVCTEFYKESGDHLPLILPCSHTLCKSCAVKLVKNEKLECPQDRLVHNTKEGGQIFPQNKYILKILEKQSENKEESEYDICPKHDREKSLFCKNSKCQKEICSVCMTEEHSQHSTVDSLMLKSQMREALIADIKALSGEIEESKRTLTATKGQISTEFNRYQEIIKVKKDAFQFTIQSKLNELSDFEKSLEILKEINNENVKFKDITAARKSVNESKTKISNSLNEPLKFGFCDVKERTVTVNLRTKHTNYAFKGILFAVSVVILAIICRLAMNEKTVTWTYTADRTANNWYYLYDHLATLRSHPFCSSIKLARYMGEHHHTYILNLNISLLGFWEMQLEELQLTLQIKQSEWRFTRHMELIRNQQQESHLAQVEFTVRSSHANWGELPSEGYTHIHSHITVHTNHLYWMLFYNHIIFAHDTFIEAFHSKIVGEKSPREY